MNSAASLKELISRHLDKFPDFDYYLPIIGKAENNEKSHPDITIECCNSLIQGISKSIILGLDPTVVKKELDRGKRENDTDKIFRRSLDLLKKNDDQYEDDFVRRGISLALSISTLRNARGDISHGRAVPKELRSDSSLARVALEMTSSLLRYSLSSFYAGVIEKLEQETTSDVDMDFDLPEVNYNDKRDFNSFLDDLYPLDGKFLYSEALYDLYYEDYLIQLDEFNEGLLEGTEEG